jgi:REP element-mobilizing transposase RayT
MGNHFHFIIRVKSVDETFRNAVQQEKTQAAFKFLAGAIDVNTFLEDQYKRLFSSYSSAYNKMFQRHGSLFQKRFRRVLIKQQGVLLNKICYVHHNPIHHGYTTVYDSWTYSSYNAYFSKASTQLEREKGLLLFTNLNEFRQTHEIYRQNRLGFSRDEIEAD